jgi:hypothetical protein
MKLRTILSVVVFALVLSAVAQCQVKKLNCRDAAANLSGHVTFDEAGGTAMFSGIQGQDRPSSPATFTEEEIKWDYDTGDNLTGHPYFALNRTTGDLVITHYTKKGPDHHSTLHCELAQQKY